MTPEKSLTQVKATDLGSGEIVKGYEIHIGKTEGPDRQRPLFTMGGEPEGATSSDGRIIGTYLHGVFAEDAYRKHFLERLGGSGKAQYSEEVDKTLNALAAHVEEHIDVDGLLEVARAAR